MDFSALNRNKQDIDDGGESGDTFHALCSYIKQHRPKVVILENVCSAPFDKMAQYMLEVNYYALHKRVDTKKYYIPHTRTRGYMICLDMDAYDNHVDLGRDWLGLMDKFERPASCSVEAFLLDEDDPHVFTARQRGFKASLETTREVDWAKCQLRHLDHRTSENLGKGRPVTRWVDNGTCKPPEYFWHAWMKGNVERVWDFIDIAHLRSLTKGFDSQYKL